jgi:hypothetical protein
MTGLGRVGSVTAWTALCREVGPGSSDSRGHASESEAAAYARPDAPGRGSSTRCLNRDGFVEDVTKVRDESGHWRAEAVHLRGREMSSVRQCRGQAT